MQLAPFPTHKGAMLNAMPRDLISPFRVLDDEQTFWLRYQMRYYEILSNSEYSKWATDSFANPTRPLNSLASELSRRVDTQIVTRHPAHYDEDVKSYIRLALLILSLLEPEQGRDGPDPTFMRLLVPLMDKDYYETLAQREQEHAALRAEIAAEKLNGPSEKHLDETEFLTYVDPRKKAEQEEEEERERALGRFRW